MPSPASISAPPDAGTPCVHCGTACGVAGLTEDQKPFCCRGCAMVYRILADHQLDHFYNLEPSPGERQDGDEPSGYDFLADPVVRAKLIESSDGRISRVTFHLPGIHCVACVWLLERLYKLHEGIGQPVVQFTHKSVTIPFSEEKISLVELAGLLRRIGYPPEFRLRDLDRKAPDAGHRRAWLQMGVAGFAFGNIMLLSFPAYLGLKGAEAAWLLPLFGGISLALSLPVLFYSAQDYFRNAWMALRQRDINIDVPIALGLIALFTQSAWDILSRTGEGYLDSLAGLVFFLLIGKSFQRRTFDALSFDRDYTHYFPIAALRVNPDGTRHSVSLDRLRPGDRICVRNTELIPADAILIHGPALVDYSFVTGESRPESRITGETLHAGGRHLGAPIEVDVIKEVSQSYLTSLWNHQAFRKEHERKFDSMTQRISRVFTLAVLAIAVLAGLFWLIVDARQAARVFAAVLIVACPCALALAAPFSFGAALRILRRHGMYLKNGAVVEGMSRVRHLAFDKTGTLTQGGVGDTIWEGRALDHDLRGAVHAMAKGSTHPLSRSIAQSLADTQTTLDGFVEHPGLGVEAWWNDKHLRLGSRAWLARAGLDLPAEHWHGAECFLAVDQQVKGRFHFADLPRAGMAEALPRLCRDYDLTVLTGDRAEGLARLREWFPGCADARPGLSPGDKLEAIESLRADGRAVMMVGDGLNDAGALRRSDVGVAVAEDIQAFSPACDAILDARALPRLPAFLGLSRASARMVRACFRVSLTYNVLGVSVAASGYLSPLIAAVLMPLSSVSVILLSVLGTRAAGRRLGLKEGIA